MYDNYLYQNIVLTKQILKCLLILTLNNNNDKSIFDEILDSVVKKGNGLEYTFCYLATIESSLDFLIFL